MKKNHPVIDYVKNVEKEILHFVDKFVGDINIYFVRDNSGCNHGHLICTDDHLSKFKLDNPNMIFYSEDELTDSERLELAREFDLPHKGDDPIEKNLVDPNTSSFFKYAALMKLTGLHNASNELIRLGLLNDVKKDTFLSTIYYSHKKLKSFEGAKNGSKKSHRLKDEIISVIKATWQKYPSLAQGRLIGAIIKRYEKNDTSMVSERTIRQWIKEKKLAPDKPEKYYSYKFDLVFPFKS